MSNNRGLIEVTGFDVIDFLTQTFQKTNYSIAVAELKEKGLLETSKDTEPIVVTRTGEAVVRKNAPASKTVLEALIGVHTERMLNSEKLRRLLLLAYINEGEARTFLHVIQQRLTKMERLLAVMLCDRSLHLLPQIEMMVAELRAKTVAFGQSRLETLAKDKVFLIAISMLRPQTTFETTGLRLAKVIQHGTFGQNLLLVLGAEMGRDVRNELASLGIDEKKNLFSYDIDGLLSKEENKQALVKYYFPMKDEIQRLISTDWALLGQCRQLFLKRVDKIPLSEQQIQTLVQVKAIFPVKDAILVTKALLDEVEKRVKLSEEFLKSKLKETKALPMLFWDSDLGSRMTNNIVVTVGDFIPDAKILETNIVLKLSPAELGFGGWGSANQEFNAVGRVDEVNRVKSAFKLAKWENREEHVIVKAAREIIKGRRYQPFTFEEALTELQKFDSRTIEILGIAVNRATPYQAIEKGHYTSAHLWNDIWRNFHRIHPLVTETEFESFKQRILETVEKRAGRKLISLHAKDLDSFPEITSFLRRRFEDRFQKLTRDDKAALFVLVKNKPTSPSLMTSPQWPKLFEAQYELIFGQAPKKDALDILLSLGLINESLWVTSSGSNYGYIATPSPFLKDVWEHLEDRVKDVKPSTDAKFGEFCSKYKTLVPELAGLEILIANKGWLTRDELKTHLWSLDHEYWRRFEDFPFIVSSKEKPVIALNSALLPEIQRFVLESKLNVLESRTGILREIRQVKSSDLVLEPDRSRGIYRGSLTLESGKEYSIFVTPWLTRGILEVPADHTRIFFVMEHQLTLELHNILKEISGVIVVNLAAERRTIVSEYDDEAINVISKSFRGLEFAKMVSRSRAQTQPVHTGGADKLPSTLRELKQLRLEAGFASEVDVRVFAGLDLFDIAFEPPETSSRGLESLLFAIPNRRMTVIAEKTKEEDYSGFLRTLMKEIYLVKKPRLSFSQKPQPNEEGPVSDDDIGVVRVIEGEERMLRFFGISSSSEISSSSDRVAKKVEMFSQLDFGFIVFYVWRQAKEILRTLLSTHEQMLPQLTLAKLKRLDLETKVKFVSRCWGFVAAKSRAEQLDPLFASARNEYYARLEEMMADRTLQSYVFMSSDHEEESGQESPEHVGLKYLMFSYFSSHHDPKMQLADISVERQTPLNPSVVPDLYVPSLRLAVEVETLYGTGATPVPRLSYLLDQYVGLDLTVWVVVPPLQSLLFAKPLSLLEKTYKSKVNCRFFTVDVTRRKVVPLDQTFG